MGMWPSPSFYKSMLLWGHNWPLGPYNRFRVRFPRCTLLPSLHSLPWIRTEISSKKACHWQSHVSRGTASKRADEKRNERVQALEVDWVWKGLNERHDKISRGKARTTMRAKFVTAGIEDVGLMVTIITRFRRGSFSIGTLEEGPRGNMAEGYSPIICKKKKKMVLTFSFWWYRGGLRRAIVTYNMLCSLPPTIIAMWKYILGSCWSCLSTIKSVLCPTGACMVNHVCTPALRVPYNAG